MPPKGKHPTKETRDKMSLSQQERRNREPHTKLTPRERGLQNYYKNRLRQNKYSRDWYRDHKTIYQKQWEEDKLSVVSHYSNGTMDCKKCGYSDIRALSIDHIKGDGAKHRREIGQHNLYKWLINNNYPDGYQVLCMNCQVIKRIENGENRELYKYPTNEDSLVSWFEAK